MSWCAICHAINNIGIAYGLQTATWCYYPVKYSYIHTGCAASDEHVGARSYASINEADPMAQPVFSPYPPGACRTVRFGPSMVPVRPAAPFKNDCLPDCSKTDHRFYNIAGMIDYCPESLLCISEIKTVRNNGVHVEQVILNRRDRSRI